MEYSLFQKLHRLADEINNAAFWKAEVVQQGWVQATYESPTGIGSTTIHLSNREEWIILRAQVEGKAQPERIQELEQQLAQALTLLRRFAKGTPNFFTNELMFDIEEEDLNQLAKDTLPFLEKHKEESK